VDRPSYKRLPKTSEKEGLFWIKTTNTGTYSVESDTVVVQCCYYVIHC